MTPKDLVEEKTHIKQALRWNGYPACLLEGADMPPLVQPAGEEVEENSLDPAPPQLWLKDPAETTVVKPPVPEKTKKGYPVVIPLRERVIRTGEKSDERIRGESVLQAHQYT